MIDIHDVRFRYSPDMPDVLRGVTTSISDGTFIAIMGSNGSGKSTLARCLNGLLLPTSGTVQVDGMMTSDPASKREVRRRVGLVFQDPNLQMTSVSIERELAFGLENICMVHEEMHARVQEYLRLFQFEDRKDNPPSSLSAGERQRLAVASVMILTPSHLVLDEATSMLSARTRTSILHEIAALRRQENIAVVLITQFPSEALLCDRLLVLHEGEIVFDDQPDRVFSHAAALTKMGVSVPIADRLRAVV